MRMNVYEKWYENMFMNFYYKKLKKIAICIANQYTKNNYFVTIAKNK